MEPFDFGLGAITGLLDSQKVLMEKRQEEERIQQEKQNAANNSLSSILADSAKVSETLVREITPLVEDTAKLDQARKEQEQLESSGNPIDFLTSIGNKIVDPSRYTYEGRQKRINENQQQVNVKTAYASQQQAALGDLAKVVQADVVASGGKLAMASLMEKQGEEQLNTEVMRVKAQTDTLAASRALIDQKLATMTEEETRAAAANSKGQPIDVGGIIISPRALEDRVMELDNRKDLLEQRALAQESKKFELDKKLAKKELETMNLEELRPMLQTGSSKYSLEDIKAVYDVKSKAQTDAIDQQLKIFRFSDFGAAVIAPIADELDRVAPAIPKNSQLAGALSTYKTNVVAVTGQLNAYKEAGIQIPPAVFEAANTALTESKKAFEAAIDKEATLKSKGDKDLKDIYMETFRGNPPPKASVEQAIGNRLEKNEPLDDIFPPDQAKLIRELYTTKLGEKKRANVMNSLDDKTIRQEAMQEAINEGVLQSISDRTIDLYRNQVNTPGNPLGGIISGDRFVGMVAEADGRGAESFKRTFGLSDEEMQAVLENKQIPGKVSGADIANLSIIQTQELMLMLDSVESGLGKKYVDWWSQNAVSYVTETRKNRAQNASATGVQQAAFESFAGGVEAQQIGDYVDLLNKSEVGYQTQKQKRYDEMVSFDLNPINRQAALLQFDSGLNDEEKKLFMKGFIIPIINEGNQKNLDFDQINSAVEAAIDANTTNDPRIAKILKKVAANRPSIVNNLESVMGNPFWRAGPEQPRMGFQPNAWLRRTTAQRSYQWFRDIQEGK